ncbi:hypothetical protein CCR75_002684 [Bremia lactucae]|uniref:Uncharacterized protein n=1 Tax=Bremia lactucae TaxID=4779 RepID=A0A976FRS6_BRELC|nr:hypothetical protein CCR75_002684 [Bremia lactucae]
MASFLLGDEYASSSSSEGEYASIATSDNFISSSGADSTTKQLLPSAEELFASETSSLLTSHVVPTSKRKYDHISRPATKIARTESGKVARTLQTAPFAPPQLRRPNISTEDRSSWTSDTTLKLQKKAQQTDARKMQ